MEETGAILFADIFGLLQLFLEGNIKDIFLSRLVDKFLHDLKRFIDHESRGNDSQFLALQNAFHILFKLGVNLGKA